MTYFLLGLIFVLYIQIASKIIHGYSNKCEILLQNGDNSDIFQRIQKDFSHKQIQLINKITIK